ncbi:MAG: pyruvate, phosphate dikinase [Candidatus Brocadia sp. AMX2]|uniref:Pyruvate, phosphate dikinase n=1 Tax=Candidatus Brocadia sinica JPN1 TaxID=1197129 RepID=A0ABQ0JUH3_9BACT|nr:MULTISPECIES: pyruvate, phosphate dikinase [Brocadia]MBC6932961.1 pyruvate, phosphate dikinase [Candidatus Brocadia sp.]MBL1169267.1 pyruvate, phosphate dikinase [Candidatus Brocadia sp. AMX1]NOG41768.1 pyruvate, phosphate dikinase [Planctomycetota bacterium]GIK14105.1 MAG: pyruvate, phosphate dikinase [Candidatus Brocadia sinica]MCE7867300.1 pyruvate, phosphate dikinase [Candidatus Brocadia sp. AMX2]
MSPKYVYFFGNGSAEGRADMKHLLGGKGANLAEMTNLGIPVPPGFTITTEVCDAYYKNNQQYPKGLSEEIEQNLSRLEKLMGAKLGDPDNPLLVSVRSGAAASMPGMMDTVLNLGLTPDAVNRLMKKTGNERFVWDAYRRFITMFGDVVMGVERHSFEEILDKYKKKAQVKSDTELTTDQLKKIVEEFKAVYKKKTRENFPNDPKVQLKKAIDAVFASWNNPRAVKYRQLYEIKGLLGTAVNVQAMVFGNMGNHSATGVCFTRNPSTGENKFYGEFLINAQGEDVVAGIRTPEPIANLEKEMPEVYKQLVKYKNILENHFKDVQDIEFTIQENRLFMLQTRTGKRTTQAAVKIAVDMVKEGLIDKKTAISRINPNELDQLLHPTFDPKAKKEIIAAGLPASPGAATGKVVFSAEDAEKWTLEKKEKVILVRKETSPEDIGGMHVAKGILTTRGGMTSHAAVVARGMGKCCVAGCGSLHVDYKTQTFKVDGKIIKRGDYISIDGSTGEVMLGMVPTVEPGLSGDFATLMEWADDVRKLKIRTNADTPTDAKKARELGAEGIGLCRTEHMFFGENRIDSVRQMILSAPDVKNLKIKITALEKELAKATNNKTDAIKKELMQVKKELKEPLNLYTSALKKLLPMQRRDFEQIFTTMDGLPVTIRFLDPPLHEFLPQEEYNQKEMARQMKISLKEVQEKVSALHELNPMLGHRGCRLGITYPEIYDMQVQAIIEAACNVKKKGIAVYPEIMLPIISTEQEFNLLKDNVHRIAKNVMEKKGMQIEYMVGTMIELPRAALIADKIAKHAEFFSFGTNDLTQMTFGFSRDDVGSFVPDYIEKGILEKDPFQILDQEGTGQLVEIGIKKGRSTRPELKVGICGEHGGNPQTILFCHKVGMNYVSCSPFRVPIARLAAAQASLQQPVSQATV